MESQFTFKHVMLLALTIFLGGCAAANPENWYSPYQYGELKGDGLRIEAEDGSFVIREGRFTPPFQTTSQHLAVSINFAKVKNKPTKPALIDSFELALAHGAKKVKVFHPATEQPLYGVLLLNKRWDDVATGPAARSYLIRVPDTYVHEAKAGGTSVVYEPVPYKVIGGMGELIGWALWLSDAPF